MPDPLSALQQFAQDLHQEVLVKASDTEDPQLREDAFTEAVLERLAEHNDVTGAEVCFHHARGRGTVPAAKLNGWALSGDGATLDLFVTLYHGEGRLENVPRSEVNDHFKRLRGFLRRAREGFHTKLEESDGVFEAARRIYEAVDTLTTVRLFFLTDGVAKAIEVEEEAVPGLELRYELWDAEKLSRLRVGQREVIELNFVQDYGGAVPCIATKDGTGEYSTFLAFLPAKLLAEIYGKHGQRLLERNVRAFLQAKGKVNKGLQQTLREEPHRFLAYNNGLCCTAAEVRLDEGRNGHAQLLWVKDFQIVNGGQTTASIFHALRREKTDISQVQVQVKLTVLTDPVKVIEIVPLISRYANSQNKVNAADFSANGKFHLHLEQLSRTVWTPPTSGLDRGTHWYYERARGSYLDDKARQGTPARMRDWAAQNPPERKFTKTDLAKYEHAWLGLPHLVCRGAEKNFIALAERHEEEGEPVVDLNFFTRLVAKAIMFRCAEKVFSALELDGYRANAVAYAVAWLAERSGHRINLDRIWMEQRVPPGTLKVLEAACAAAHEHLLSAEGNIGEWSKKQDCWEAFQGQDIASSSGWENEWAAQAFASPTNAGQTLAVEWDRVRIALQQDARTMEGLETFSGINWLPARRRHTVAHYAAMTFEELRQGEGLKMKRIRELIQMFAIASQG
jgi:AIPR protein